VAWPTEEEPRATGQGKAEVIVKTKQGNARKPKPKNYGGGDRKGKRSGGTARYHHRVGVGSEGI